MGLGADSSDNCDYQGHAWENLNRVTSQIDISGPLYATVDAVVSTLEARTDRR